MRHILRAEADSLISILAARMAHQLQQEAEPVHDKSGVLWKKSKLGFSWNRRYVRAHNGVLEVAQPAPSAALWLLTAGIILVQVRNRPSDSNCKMSIPLEYASIASRPAAGRGQYRIEIVTALHAKYQFAAENSRDGNEWYRARQMCIVVVKILNTSPTSGSRACAGRPLLRSVALVLM